MKIQLLLLIPLSLTLVNTQDNGGQVTSCAFDGYNVNCSQCYLTETAEEYCLECQPEYSMDHGKCIKGVNVPPENIQCPENCLECEINVENVDFCTKCEENKSVYLTSDNTCSPCPLQCDECSSNNFQQLTCKKCKTGSKFNNEICAEESIKFCTAYYIDESTNNIVCHQCQEGYSKLDMNSCAKCPFQCSSCYKSFYDIGFQKPIPLQCSGCIDGSQPNTNGVCGRCPSECEHDCQYGLDSTLQCVGSYSNTKIKFLQ